MQRRRDSQEETQGGNTFGASDDGAADWKDGEDAERAATVVSPPNVLRTFHSSGAFSLHRGNQSQSMAFSVQQQHVHYSSGPFREAQGDETERGNIHPHPTFPPIEPFQYERNERRTTPLLEPNDVVPLPQAYEGAVARESTFPSFGYSQEGPHEVSTMQERSYFQPLDTGQPNAWDSPGLARQGFSPISPVDTTDAHASFPQDRIESSYIAGSSYRPPSATSLGSMRSRDSREPSPRDRFPGLWGTMPPSVSFTTSPSAKTEPEGSPILPASRSEDKGTESPQPQNLRGDPFRSAKIKTELCRNYGTEKGCPFGDKCNYAHGVHELKFSKLMDLERAGLVDIEIFRTHPCPTWVATGACPFDQRCAGLHDPRVMGRYPSWLPHSEVSVSSTGPHVHIDKLYHERLAATYSCSPFYGYAPSKKWKGDPSRTRAAWKEFYAFICNIEPRSMNSFGIHWLLPRPSKEEQVPQEQEALSTDVETDNIYVTELQRLAIVLKMRERQMGQCYVYLPTHLFCKELCMVLQIRVFQIVHARDNGDVVSAVSEITDQVIVSSLMDDRRDIVVAREIAFGPVGDPSVYPVSIWFNIPPNEITLCTRQQARRHKRSRHRLNKKLKQSSSSRAPTPSAEFPSSSEEFSTFLDCCPVPPFSNHQPMDEAAFDLATGIISHRVRVLEAFSSGDSSKDISQEVSRVLANEEERLQASFECQRRCWMTWSWPRRLRFASDVDDLTDVPVVERNYNFVVSGHEDYQEEEIFHGIDDGQGAPVTSESAKLASGFIWKSFVINMQLDDGRIKADEVAMPSHDVAFWGLRRLPTLRSIPLGVKSHGVPRALPRLKKAAIWDKLENISTPEERERTLDSILRGWEGVEAQYEKRQSSPDKLLMLSTDLSSGNTSQTSSELHNERNVQSAAYGWTRQHLLQTIHKTDQP